MATIRIVNGEDRLYNGAGEQVIGSHAPDQQGLSPKEMLEGALALCVSITLQKVLERDGFEYDKEEIVIEVKASKAEGVTNRFTDFHTKITFPSNIEEERRRKLLLLVERGCTIGNTLRNDVTIETEVAQ